MIIKITIGSWRFTWSMAPITEVVGCNSNLPNGKHILMWDFDMQDESVIAGHLKSLQYRYGLPDIYIMKTSPKQGFHAYCFKAVDFKKCVEILAATPSIDWNYFKYGMYRGHFTLRVSPKCGRVIKPYRVLHSQVHEDACVEQMTSWVQYETLSDAHKSKKIEVKLFAKEG